jgi:hypothetical protein
VKEHDDHSDEHPEEGEASPDSLSDELIKRYDPRRLLQMVSKRAGKGERLDLATRSKFERRLGVDLSDVRIYTGEFAEQVTRQHNAEAVTIGATGMVLMGGSPHKSSVTAQGRALLAHELTHVAQKAPSLHRAAMYGDISEFTKEHEIEAEAHELAELQADSGLKTDAGPESEISEIEYIQARFEAVLLRVLELFEEDERLDSVRNGSGRTRP